MSGKSFSHSMFFKVGNIVFRICMVLSIVVSNLVLQTGTASAKGTSVIPQDLPEKNTIQNSIEGVDAFLDRANDNRHKNMMPVENENEQVFSEALLEESNYLLAPLMDAGVPDVSLSTLEISDPAKANGTEAITLTATILDENSDPVEGVEVLFNVSGGEVDISYQNTESDSNGQVIATVTSTKIGPKPVTAYIIGSGVDTDTVAIAQSGAAIFMGAIISGTVFLDNNRNGVMNSDESGVLGITVDLLNGDDEVVASTQSVGDGVYQMEGLDAGTYRLAIESTQEYGAATAEKNISLSVFENRTEQNFAVYTTALITGTIWDDVNHDKVMDETENMMEGVTVNLSGDAGSMSTETDENGEYSFAVETEHPDGPDNFSFESKGYVIDDDLSASIFNGDFEDEGYVLDDSYFPENYNFETPGYVMDDSYFPENYNFETPGYVMDDSYFPENYNFETPGYVMDDSYFPENYNFETPGYVMDDSYFPENYNFETGDLSGWETDNFAISTDSYEGNYAAYRTYGASSNLISPVFTVPEEAQSISWWYKSSSVENGYFYLLDAETDEELVTMYSDIGTSGSWKKYYYNISEYAGQQIKFKFYFANYSNWVAYLDNIQLEVNIPGWTIDGQILGGSWQSMQIVDGSHDESHAVFRPKYAKGAIISSAFTIPDGAQSITWWLKNEKASGTYFCLLDAETNETLVTLFGNAGTNGAWKQYSFNISPYIGREVKFKTVTSTSVEQNVYLDDIQLEVNIPGWTIDGQILGGSWLDMQIVDGSHDESQAVFRPKYAKGAIISSAFTIPDGAQSITWWLKNEKTSGTYFYLLDAETNETLATLFGNAGTNGAWKQYSFNISPYIGREVKFKTVTSTSVEQNVYLDDIQLEVNIPGWTIDGQILGGSWLDMQIVDGSHDESQAVFRPKYAKGAIISSAFTIPDGAQSITWWLKNEETSGTYFYLLDAETNETLTTLYSNMGTNGVWKQYSYNVSPYIGREVKFKTETSTIVEQNVYFDDIQLEVNIPGWTINGDIMAATYIIGVSEGSYDGSHSSFKPLDATGELVSSVFEVPEEAQSLTWWFQSGGNEGSNFELYDADTDDLLIRMYSDVGSTDWKKYSFNISPYIGKRIKFACSNPTGHDHTTKLDDIQLEVNIPGWTINGDIMAATYIIGVSEGSYDGSHSSFKPLDATGELVSSVFEVPEEAQSLTWWFQSGGNEGSNFELYDADTGNLLVRMYSDVGSTDWKKYSFNISPYIGKRIKFACSNPIGHDHTTKLDDIQLEVNIPGWTINGDIMAATYIIGVSEGSYDGSHSSFKPLDATGELVSSVFEVPEEAQSLTWWLKSGGNEGSNIELYDADTGNLLVRMYSDVGSTDWKKYNFNISPYIGKRIKFVCTNPMGHDHTVFLDEILISPYPSNDVTINQVNPIGYYSSTGNLINENLYGGQRYDADFGIFTLDYDHATIDVSATEVLADGVTPVEVTFTVVDGTNSPIEGFEIQIETDSAVVNLEQDELLTDENGQVTATITSDVPQTVTIQARDVAQNLVFPVMQTVYFYEINVDADLSTIIATPDEVPLDGETVSTITVTALDDDSIPIENADVTLYASGHATVTQPETTTDENGQAVGYISDTSRETVSVSAMAGGVDLNNTASIVFYGTDLRANLLAPLQVMTDQTVNLSLSVENLEDYPVNDVDIALTLPEGLEFSSHSYSDDPVIDGQSYTWSIDSLSANENVSFTVLCTLADAVAVDDTLSVNLAASSNTNEINASNNTDEVSFTIVDGYSFESSIDPRDTSLYLGGESIYAISINNTNLLPDLYTISVSGLDQFTTSLSAEQIALNAGDSDEISLIVSADTCISETIVNFSVAITSTETGVEQVIPATLTLDTAPEIMLDAPRNNATSGSSSVLFSWRTEPATTGTLSIHPTDNPDAVQTYTSEMGTNHAIQVENLTRNISYTWHVDVASDCGSNSSVERELDIGNGILFSNHNQNITIDRDYDQRINVAVQNTDSISHTLTSSVINPYEDLIVNFVDSGSMDQTVTLEPGETANLTLALHAQDAELREYILTANLVADEDSVPIIDNANINVEVLFEGDYSIVEDLTAYDPVTLAHTYVITNNGQTITDLSLEAIDPSTGMPASVYLSPGLDHAKLETGESIRVVAYPIFTAEDAVNHIAYSPTLRTAKISKDAVSDIPFILKAKAAGMEVSVSGISTCGTGNLIYSVQITGCALGFSTSDWYCTNRPTVSTPFTVPAFISKDAISGVSVDMSFSPRSNVRKHSGEIFFNGTQVISFDDQLPQGTFSYDIPIELWNEAMAGMVTQNFTLVSHHPNPGHYVSGTNYKLNINVDNATTYACATTQSQAQEAVNIMYPCGATVGFNPATDVYDKSIWALGEIKSLIKSVAADLGYDVSVSICTQGECGDPIDSRTGVFSFATPDISFPTSAGTLAFQRAYSSGAIEQYSEVGYGWTHNHAERLIFPDSMYGLEDYMIFRDHLGNQHLFKIEGDGTYTPGPGVLAELEAVTGGYQVTTADNHVFTFNDIGMVLSINDAQGNAFTYTYDIEGVLQRVSADNGSRYLDFTYNDDIRIEMVTDYTGRTVTFAYDEDGDLISSTDLLGQEWTYEYDAAHRMTALNDPTGLETVSTEYDMLGRAFKQFDADGKLLVKIIYHDDGSVTVEDADGHSETHSYDSRGILIDETDQVNRGTDTNYDANFRPTSITNEIGSELTMEWSEDGKQLLAEVDPAGNRTEYTYDENGNLTSTTDPSGNTKSYTYDGNLLTSSTDIEGKTTTYTYTAEGWLETQTDHYGRTTTYTYDEHGQRLTTTDWQGVITSNVYDELGRQIESVDEQGRVNRNEYNAAGQLVRSIRNYDAARPQNDGNVYNLTTTYTYDVYGNQKTVTDTLGNTTTYHYDTNSRLTSTINAMGHETTNTYDANGQLVKSTDALGRETTYVYDAAGRRLSTVNALGISSGTTTFDLTHNASTASDSAGNAATYYYNALNQVVRIVDPMGHETSTTYNENGNVETKTDELGRTTTYEYDALNRLVKTTDDSGAVTQTVYDENGYRTATIDALGNETTYTYDEMGRVVSTTDALGHTTSSDYDEDGRLVSTTDAMGRTTTYTYDEWDRKASMTDGAGRTTTYTYDELDRVISTSGPTGTTSTVYDALGRVVSRTDARGHTTTTTYDDLGRVKTSTDYQGNTTTKTYDQVGNLLSSVDLQGTTSFEYDVLNRQIAVTDPLGNRTQTVYDNLGNVSDNINAKGIVTHYVYDSLQRNTAIIQNYKPGEEADVDTNVRVDYTYNAVGNRTYVNDANGHVTEFHYDAADRVTRKTDPIGNTWDYVYDLVGNLTSRTDGNNVTTYFVYDDGGNLLTIDYPEGEADVSFTYNNAGQRVSMTDDIGTTTWHYDELSRVDSVNDAYGNEIVYTYDEYGNRTGLQYADGKQVAYDFDSSNRLVEVASWDSLETEYDYDTLGQLTSILRPNGVESTYEYDALGRLTTLMHATDTTDLANYNYTYDELGNIIHAEENVMGGGSYGPTVQVTVVDTTGEPLSEKTVYAYSGDEFSSYSKVTDEKGQVSITLPEGNYRFRVDVDGIEFWSGENDHCEIGACGPVTMTIPEAVLVTVIDSNNNYLAEQVVYAYEGETYSKFSGETDENGQVSLRLPEGEYRFKTMLDSTTFWSAALEDEQCVVPGCTVDEILVTVPLLVTVQNDLGDPMPELTVYAYDGKTYTDVSGQTDENGQVELTLPEGEYHFRAVYNSTDFWSADANHCAIPGCSEAAITVSLPVTVTVVDTAGNLIPNINVYAFDEITYQNVSKKTDENGEAVFTLAGGNYRFRADYNGTQFWSGSENTCEIPGCTIDAVTVTQPVPVTVLDSNGAPQAGLNVYAFDGSTYKSFSKKTDSNGVAVFTLPLGDYRFRADLNGTQFWSGASNTCSLPDCNADQVAVTIPVEVFVQDGANGVEAVNVYAFNETVYSGYSKTTDSEGVARFTLPEGEYRFRADYAGEQIFSDTNNHCSIPGCELVSIQIGTEPTETPTVMPTETFTETPTLEFTETFTFTPVQTTEVVNTNTPTPQYTNTPVPDYTNTLLPQYTDTSIPEETNTPEPVETDTPEPVNTDTPLPQYSSTPTQTIGMISRAGHVLAKLRLAPLADDTGVSVTVLDSDGTPQIGLNVYAFDGTTYSGSSAVTNESGIASFTLAEGSYRFRADLNGTRFWSGEDNTCTTPSCVSDSVTVTKPLTITVVDSDGTAQSGLNVYAFNGTTYAGYSKVTNENGEAVFTLPEGDYRFRADLNGTRFWSADENHCSLPGCESAGVTVTKPITVTVRDSSGTIQSGLNVYAFDGTTYSGYSKVTDENGAAVFTLPEGNYHFRADLNGTRFWSAEENHCTLPGCESVDVSVSVPLSVSVVDTDGTPQSGIAVYAFNGTTYMNFSKTTDENGLAVFTLPEGDYRFRADAGGTQYWSSEENDCTLPGCSATTVTTSKPVTVSVVDSVGAAMSGLNVYAFDGTTYAGYSKVSDEYGNAVFYLPAGDYRFRADREGTQFWSSEENDPSGEGTCTIPGCENVIISVTLSVTVNVTDTDGTPQEGLNVYAFDGETYSNYSKVTDENGLAVFSLPEGDYHFRADLNGTQFWSADENTCTLPGCISDSVTVTKSVTVTVAGEEGNPYTDLNVYVFNGETYAGYSGKTDAGGHVTFTLPQGDYHFRANYDGVEFWSGNENTCTIPGCEEDSVILPGGTGEQEVSIDYTYDALNRLISAEYSNGTAFGYTYDAAGNVLTYAETHYGQTKVTTYTYDAANQLLTAIEDETVWQYSYDGNGSLIQTNPGTEVANGSTRYTYNTAGYLTKIENYTTEWQTQSEMTYDGLGNRLEVTTYSDGEGNTTRYVLDGGSELTAIGEESSTYYLYGMGVIGTFGESWSNILSDGAGSTRQLIDEEGTVTLSISYTPWGDTMEIFGSGMLNLGYLGGVYDAGTGLIYMGNGQYYDPSMGRFLTRGANEDNTNPYTPWSSDPAGMLIAPLALLALVFGRKKTRTKFDQFIILLVLVISLSVSLSISLPVKAQSVSSATTNTSSNTYPLGYVTVTIGGTYDKDIASNPGSGVEVYRFAIICNEEPQSSSKVILFGGSGGSITEPGPPVELQMPVWLDDGDDNEIPKDQLIRYDGNKVRTAIFADKENLLPNQSVILIGYSAGTESVLIYARLRLKKGQMVDTIVLLGPTFECTIDGDILFASGNGQKLFVFGDSTDRGREFNDWWDYFDYFQNQGVDILVVDDGYGRDEENAYDINSASDYLPPENANGDYDYWLNSLTWRQHYNAFRLVNPFTWRKGTNRSEKLKNKVYEWINKY